MKYGEIKDALFKNGFKLGSIQTGGELDMLGFSHPNITGEIFVDFGQPKNLPQHIIDGEIFDYNEDLYWLREIEVYTVIFEINVGMSYMTENVIDTHGMRHENSIYLINYDEAKDVDNYFHIALALVVDSETLINYQLTYNEKILEFVNHINRFLPLLKQLDLKLYINKTSGKEDTIFSSLSYDFLLENTSFGVGFVIKPLTWDTAIYFSLKFGELEQEDIRPIDISLEEFEKLFKEQYKEFRPSFEGIYKRLIPEL